MVGYNRVISIEHEEGLTSVHGELTNPVAFLKECLLTNRQHRHGGWNCIRFQSLGGNGCEARLPRFRIEESP